MKTKSLHRKIKRHKLYLNFLLNYLSPTNVFIIYLSTKLDKLVYASQKRIYKKYKKRNKNVVLNSKAA